MARPEYAWMVRAGNDNLLADQVEIKQAIAIGWPELGDVSSLETREDFKARYRISFPDDSERRVSVNAGQVFNFACLISEGDYLLTYEKATRELIIGIVEGSYAYDPRLFGEDYPQVRHVKWCRRVSRDLFTAAARNSMGSTLTVFRLEDHLDEIHTLATQEEPEPVSTPVDEEEPPFHEDVRSRASELIADLVSRLDGYQFQELVAGTLRAMGFHAVSSSPGRDRGVDIVAAPDPLGLEEPRIKVQVKHRSSSVSGEEMRAFLTASQGYSPLFVSTGGFSPDARYEAERAGRSISLLDRDEFINVLLENYNALEQDFKAMVPLIQVWVPITD